MGAGASTGTGHNDSKTTITKNQYADDCPIFEVTASRSVCFPSSLKGRLCKLILGKEALVVCNRETGKPIVLFPYYRILSWGSNLGSVQFRVVVTEKKKTNGGPIDLLNPQQNPSCTSSKAKSGEIIGSDKAQGASDGKEVSNSPDTNSGRESSPKDTPSERKDNEKSSATTEEKLPPPPPPPEEVQKTVTIAFLTVRGKAIEEKIMAQVKELMSKMDSMVRE